MLAYMPYLMIKVLTISKLMMSLVLNNWSLVIGYGEMIPCHSVANLTLLELFLPPF